MAFDAYLYFVGGPKVEGETTDATFKANKAVTVLSFSFGASNPVTLGSATGGGGAGKVNFSDLNVMVAMDTSTAQLLQMLSAGGHVDTATLVVRKSGGTVTAADPFYTVTMTSVFCSSLQISGGGEQPMVSFSLAYGSITTVYQKQSDKGVLSTGSGSGWDIQANVAK